MVNHTSIKIIISMVAHMDLELKQMYVKKTFLHGELEDIIHMMQPKCY